MSSNSSRHIETLLLSGPITTVTATTISLSVSLGAPGFPDVAPSTVQGTTSLGTPKFPNPSPAVIAVTTSITTPYVPVCPLTIHATAAVYINNLSSTVTAETVRASASLDFVFEATNGRWKFVDLVNSEVYEFDIGPSEEDIGGFEKAILYQNTLGPSSIDGATPTVGDRRTLIMEKQEEVRELSISGTIVSQAQYETFVDWYERRHQVTVVDDLGRQFLVYIRDFEAKRRRVADTPWLHDYTINATVLPS